MEFVGGDQGALLDVAMTWINRLCRSPIAAIQRGVANKEVHVGFEGGLIAFGKEDGANLRCRDAGTCLRRGMQRIHAHDPLFHRQGKKKPLNARLLTFFVVAHGP